MTRLAFNERGHVYTLDRQRVPSVSTVTRVLDKPGLAIGAVRETATWAAVHREAYDVMGDSAWRAAAERAHRDEWNARANDGRALHTLAESLVYGQLMPDEVNGEPVNEFVAGCAEQLARFFDAWNVQPVLHETFVYHERYRYAGRFDLLADLSDGQRWLLDYKTTASGIYPETGLQLTGYRNATHYVDADNVDQPLADVGIADTAAVWLRPDRWELVPVRSDAAMWGWFLHCGALSDFLRLKREEVVYDALPRPEQAAS